MKNVGSEATLQNAVDRLNAVRREIAKIIVGQDDVVEGVLICLLSGGHVLLVTERGEIKRSEAAVYASSHMGGSPAIDLPDGDRVVAVNRVPLDDPARLPRILEALARPGTGSLTIVAASNEPREVQVEFP